jgi:hypothetical protein
MEPLDTIDWEYQKKKVKIPVLGFKQTMKVGPQTRVYGKYASDGSPAMVIHSYGRGAAFLFGTFVGSAYVRSGIPIRPVDRGATQDSFAHFLPSKFDDDLVDIVTAACGDVRWDVITDNPMVETVVLEGPKGLAVACINWTPTPQKVMLSVQYLPKNIQKATSIAHGLLPSQRRGVVMDFRLQVDVADMVILE